MKPHHFPHASVMAFAAMLATGPALAQPPSDVAPPPAIPQGEPVADAELAAMTGRSLGPNMLVGLRIDLVSDLTNAQGGSGRAVSSLYIMRTDQGFDVRLHSQADAASAGSGSATTAQVGGGESLQVSGIGQIAQIAGDGNRMANMAVISVGTSLAAPDGFNGQTEAQAGSGDVSARVAFGSAGGVHVGVASGGATLSQTMSSATSGQIMQVGQIAGNGFVASNTMNLQLATSAMSAVSAQQAAIHQALAAVSGLRR